MYKRQVYEKALTKRAKAYLGQYSISTDFTEDLKQIFAAVAWNKLKEYDADDPIPFLQKIKYDALHAWHEFIRLSCGATAVLNEKMYTCLLYTSCWRVCEFVQFHSLKAHLLPQGFGRAYQFQSHNGKVLSRCV